MLNLVTTIVDNRYIYYLCISINNLLINNLKYYFMKHSISSLDYSDSYSLINRFSTECMINSSTIPCVDRSILDLYAEYEEYCSIHQFSCIYNYIRSIPYQEFIYFVDQFLSEIVHFNFSFSEFLHSDVALSRDLGNCLFGTKRLYVIYFLHLVSLLQQLRSYAMCPIIVNSGYRSRLVNQAVGGRPFSRHLFLKAADITIPSRSREALRGIELFAKSLPFRFVHNYGTYIHVDIN